MDKQDAFMTRQAFQGVYPVVGTIYKHKIRNPILVDLGLEHYTGYNGTTGNDNLYKNTETQHGTPQSLGATAPVGPAYVPDPAIQRPE